MAYVHIYNCSRQFTTTMQSAHINGRKHYGTTPRKHHKINNRILLCVCRARYLHANKNCIKIQVYKYKCLSIHVCDEGYSFILAIAICGERILFHMISWFPLMCSCKGAINTGHQIESTHVICKHQRTSQSWVPLEATGSNLATWPGRIPGGHGKAGETLVEATKPNGKRRTSDKNKHLQAFQAGFSMYWIHKRYSY